MSELSRIMAAKTLNLFFSSEKRDVTGYKRPFSAVNEKVKKLLDHAKVATVEKAYIRQIVANSKHDEPPQSAALA